MQYTIGIMHTNEYIYDYIVIGSGFGGSVAALRLAEKGYSVLVLEKGKRWQAQDFPRSNWQLSKYLWVPALRWFGFQRLSFFREVMVISGVGVGGGSIVYANTHIRPPDAFYSNPRWAAFNNWKEVLRPFYDLANRMLGSAVYTPEYVEDRLLKEVAEEMGRGHTYGPVEGVGIYLGSPQQAVDPYFEGLGPLRTGCTHCAGCMVGCRHDAKNTLDKNYLWLAERHFGARIVAETQAERIDFADGLYTVSCHSSTARWRRQRVRYQSRGLVVSAGVLGSMNLLLRQKYQFASLPRLSDRLGENLMTNSEMLSGVLAAREKLNHGIAISRVFAPDEQTNVEIVKFPDGSGLMARLGAMAAGPGSPPVRTLKMLWNTFRHPLDFLRVVFNRQLASTGVFFLIMQTLDNAMRMQLGRGLLGRRLRMVNDGPERVPTFIPKGQEAMLRYARKAGGVPQNAITEITLNLATTAHILGGCPMGTDADTGVVDPQFRVHGYPNMYILDGSVIPCNLGVNPSLTITALSEYAMSLVPDKPGHQGLSLEARMAAQRAQQV
jgi:cholesterol oxidase